MNQQVDTIPPAKTGYWEVVFYSFVLVQSSCKAREESENSKMEKKSCQQLDSIPLPPAVFVGSL